MKFSYQWLKDISGFREKASILADLITMHSLEVESTKKNGVDYTFDIKIFPNRFADAASYIGIAREISAIQNKKLKILEPKVKEDKKLHVRELLDVSVKNKKCLRYSARVIQDIKIAHSPAWLVSRLESSGLKSINNVVDAANYVMLETGQPLHVFDYDKIRSIGGMKKIIVKSANQKENFLSLDDKNYVLDNDTLIITDGEKTLAIAGIKGGKSSEIDISTKNIILESANFDADTIRLSSQKLNLKTDASYRFEHGLDPFATIYAINRLAKLINDSTGGKTASGIIDIFPNPPKISKIIFNPSYADKIIGINIPLSFYRSAFINLGCDVLEKNKVLLVTPPSYRLDLKIEEDLIEEASRLYGYEKILEKPPKAFIFPAERNDAVYWRSKIKNIIKELGYIETFIYEFIGDNLLANFEEDKAKAVEIQNPMNPETKYLLTRPIYKYLVSLRDNSAFFNTVKIFGTAKSFLKNKNGAVDEKEFIALASSQKNADENLFYRIKGEIDFFFTSLGINDYWHKNSINTESEMEFTRIYHPFRRQLLKIAGETVGVMGEIHPHIAKKLKLKSRVVAMELDCSKIIKYSTAESEYIPISNYPAVERDIAVSVPLNTLTEDVTNVIENAAGPDLADSDIFDYFQDSSMEIENQKSMAFHLVFQSHNRTLTDKDVEEYVKKITSALAEKGWEIRG